MISSWGWLGFPFGFGVGSWHPREALQEARRFLDWIPARVWRRFAVPQKVFAGGEVFSGLHSRSGLAWVRGTPERLCRRRGDFILGSDWIPVRVWCRSVAPQIGSAV